MALEQYEPTAEEIRISQAAQGDSKQEARRRLIKLKLLYAAREAEDIAALRQIVYVLIRTAL